jgi:transposase
MIHVKMTHGKACSDDLVILIHRLRRKGKSYGEIAKLVEKSRSTVSTLLRTTVVVGDRVTRSARGRHRCTTNADDRAIGMYAKRHRFDSKHSIGRVFDVSKQTVRRRLKERGIVSRKAHRNILNKRERLARKRWCRNMLRTDFSTWLFSDECSFELSNCSTVSRAWVLRKAGEKYVRCCVLNAPVKSRQKVHIWGCISSVGVGTFRVLTQTVNRHVCIQTYSRNLLPLYDSLPLSWTGRVVFQQDNARPHVAADTMRFLARKRITTTQWPAYSPDINPIENVWALMKNFVRRCEPQNVTELIAAIQSAWKAIVTAELCNRLYSSMRGRLLAVIRKAGLR